MAGRLHDTDMDVLEQWIGTGPKTFTLLYKITRDGCNATTFYQKCDGKGATVTVLYNQHNSVFGGYVSQSWNSFGFWAQDGSAFLYQLHYNGTPVRRRFNQKGPTNTYFGGASYHAYGLTFGGGYDLGFQNTIPNSGGCFTLNGSQTFGGSYDMQGLTEYEVLNGTRDVTELEVYAVADGTRPKIIPIWRETPILNEKLLEKLTKEVEAFKPIPELKSDQARILMIGLVGAGKSSFYNTVDSIFKGRKAHRAFSGSAEKSLTTAFNPESPITPETVGFISTPSAADKIHCVAFVIDATTLDVLPEKVLQKMKNFQKMMKQKGILQSILLTKIDKLCKFVQSDVSKVFQSEAVMKQVDKAAELFGVPRGDVHPVRNYEGEVQLKATDPLY